MRIENINPHKKNTKVTVNGNTYQIGAGGFICDEAGAPLDVAKADAAKLCQGKAWQELSWDPSDERNAGRFYTAPEGRKGVGRPVRSMNELNWQQGGAALTPEQVKPLNVREKLSVDPPEETIEKSEEPVEEPAAEAVEAAPPQGMEEVVTESGEEWPDPTTEMDVEYLRKMADAYSVKYTGRTGKARLVKDITAEMYEE